MKPEDRRSWYSAVPQAASAKPVEQNNYSSRQRVALAIQHRAPDRIPKGELCFDDAVVRQRLNCGRVGYEERLEFVKRLGLDLICHAPVYPDLGGGLPDAGDSRWPDLERWILETPLFSFAVLDGSFGWGMRTLGFQKFLTLPRSSPLSLTDLIARVERLNLELFRCLLAQGIDGIVIADDIAYQRGLLVRPETMRECFFPSLARQVEKMAGEGVPVFYHSDGNFYEVISDLVDMGFQGLHCIERGAGMDVTKLQQEFGEKLCLWGHLDADDLKKAGTRSGLRDLIAGISELTARKGFILGTNCGLFEGIDLDSLTAIYEAVERCSA